MNPLTPPQVDELLRTRDPLAPVYLIGVGGCGMSGLGHLLSDLGIPFVGSDLADNEEIRQLRLRGAMIHGGHLAQNLEKARPCLVVYSSAIRLDNPELAAARQSQIPIVRRAVLLAALMGRQRGICVAGMHGKTTTTAMLAYALEQLGLQPSYAVGALVPQLPNHARIGARGKTSIAQGLRAEDPNLQDNWFVAEADESDGTLREFHPEHAILLNLDEEHLDYYANWEAICAEFSQFIRQTRGPVFFCADDPRLSELLLKCPAAISYGFSPQADYRVAWPATAAADNETSTTTGAGLLFEVSFHGQLLGEFALPLVGEKNASNATAVIALLHHLGLAPADIAEALRSFRGAARRQQELFRDSRHRVFDDYGHHPREIGATVRALRSLPGARRLLVAFQPHRFTRTKHLLQQFATCFNGVDQLWIAEIYAASEPAIAGVDGATLTAAVRAAGQPADFVPDLDTLGRVVRAALQPGDWVLFLGAGDITRVAHQLARQLRAEGISLLDAACQELAGKLSAAAVIRRDEPMAQRTTMRVGGRADWYVEPATEGELAEVLAFCARRGLAYRLMGRGSNLLIRDGGVRGMVICLAHPAFARVEARESRIHCGAGARLRAVVLEARRQSLGGLEFLEGIPGSVGGALRMNAGAMGSSFFSVVETVRVMDAAGQIREIPADQLRVEYRACPSLANQVALAAVLRGVPASLDEIDRRLESYHQHRWKSQPAMSSAGCVFKNPAVMPAGKLIDELGLKGARVGGAMVSERHANFIVNTGNATARDVLQLIQWVQDQARNQRGVQLETEVEIMGDNE